MSATDTSRQQGSRPAGVASARGPGVFSHGERRYQGGTSFTTEGQVIARSA